MQSNHLMLSPVLNVSGIHYRENTVPAMISQTRKFTTNVMIWAFESVENMKLVKYVKGTKPQGRTINTTQTPG